MTLMESNMNQNKHILHPEEEILFGNFQHGHDILLDIHNRISGENSDVNISYKMDGSPAIVFGYHPVTKKFFVGTKSVFNNKPKINYTIEDILENHGTNLKLMEILNICLEVLPDTIIDSTGIYQGDVLFLDADKEYYVNDIMFKSNTLNYQVNRDSIDYKKVHNALLGIAVHTKYIGETDSEYSLDGLKSEPFSCYDLLNSELVYIPRLYVNTNNVVLPSPMITKNYLGRAQLQYETLSDNEKALIVKHGLYLKMFYNYNIKNDLYNNFTEVGPTDYYEFLENQFDTTISKYKTQKSIDKYTDIKNEHLSDVTNNSVVFMTLMLIYANIVNAKNFLVSSLNTAPSSMNQYINDESTGPEGYVACSKTGMSKLVHRHIFSKHNFITFQQKSNL